MGDIPEAEWDRVQGVMLRGVYLCMKYELPHLLATGGAIVNTASGAGLVAYPGQSPYVSSKHGVLGLTKSAALEYGRQGVRINAVCPGTVLTPMVETATRCRTSRSRWSALHPIGRIGTPDEVAERGAVALLRRRGRSCSATRCRSTAATSFREMSTRCRPRPYADLEKRTSDGGRGTVTVSVSRARPQQRAREIAGELAAATTSRPPTSTRSIPQRFGVEALAAAGEVEAAARGLDADALGSKTTRSACQPSATRPRSRRP